MGDTRTHPKTLMEMVQEIEALRLELQGPILKLEQLAHYYGSRRLLLQVGKLRESIQVQCEQLTHDYSRYLEDQPKPLLPRRDFKELLAAAGIDSSVDPNRMPPVRTRQQRVEVSATAKIEPSKTAGGLPVVATTSETQATTGTAQIITPELLRDGALDEQPLGAVKTLKMPKLDFARWAPLAADWDENPFGDN